MANRLGRPTKGPRSAVMARMPVPHREVYEQEAAKAGLPLGDYVALCMARMHELNDPEYIHRDLQRNQEALPIGA